MGLEFKGSKAAGGIGIGEGWEGRAGNEGWGGVDREGRREGGRDEGKYVNAGKYGREGTR